MSSRKLDLGDGIWASWGDKWRIPSTELGSVLAAFAMYGLFFLWLGLSVLGVEAEAIKEAHRLLPQWFFFADLFAAPALAALVAGPLPIRPVLRLALAVLMLCSFSLSIVPREHQAVGLGMLGFVYLEVFLIIPRWNRWHKRRMAMATAHGAGEGGGGNLDTQSWIAEPRKPDRRHRLRDFALYTLIAVTIVTVLVIHVLR